MRFASLPVLAALWLGSGLADATADPIWSYDGDQNNQDEWATLSNDYAACMLGTAQSPIIISFTQEKKLPPLVTRYAASPVHMKLADYTLAIDVAGHNTLSENGRRYTLKQIRVHTPGEHKLLERFWPVEFQLMHYDAKGKLLILSSMVLPGEANPAIQAIIDHLPPDADAATDFTLDPGALLPAKRGYYAYTGSLTYPPCTEGVEWRVLKDSITLSMPQLSALAKLLGRNARLPQPVYMRTIGESHN